MPTPPSSRGPGRARQDTIYRAGVQGRRPAVPTDFATLERAARRRARRLGWAYAAGGAGEGATMRANREAFERWKIVPRVLRQDLSVRDLSIELLGTAMPAPVLLAPIGVQTLLHDEGELASARAAAVVGLPLIASTASATPLEEIAEANGDAPRWYQLYWPNDDELAASMVVSSVTMIASQPAACARARKLSTRPSSIDQYS